MSQLKKFIRLFFIRPGIAVSKVLDIYSNKFKHKKLKDRYLTNSSFQQNPFKSGQKLYNLNLFPDLINNISEIEQNKKNDNFEKLVLNLINHNFNLLGSDWKNVNKIVKNKIKNLSNELEQNRIIDLIDKDYRQIDWQIDFKSGYRWDVSTFYKDIKFGTKAGADIKIPWELGRMQQIQLLIIYYELINKDGIDKSVISSELKNQILDFIASNAPGFGVQWASTMDVAIRAVNLVLASSFLKKANIEFDNDFESYLISSIYEHGKHIIDNLEWSAGMRGNHYLANITGIILIASHLPITQEINSWLEFGINELMNEILYQFNEDGSNFEASTNYHLFSAEMVFSSIFVLLNLPKEKLTALNCGVKTYYNYALKKNKVFNGLWLFDAENKINFKSRIIDRLKKIYEFSSAIINEEGVIPQIGDNDSGQLLIPNYDLTFESHKPFGANHLSQLDLMKKVLELIDKLRDNSDLLQFSVPKEFKDFGLYILEKENVRLYIKCGSIGQMGKGGHSHNDQLSFELFIGKENVIVDPGTYCYTSEPQLRNEYRSTKMHNTLWFEGLEQNEWWNESADDLFWLKKDKAKAKKIEFSENQFAGEHFGYRKPHKREFTILKSNDIGRETLAENIPIISDSQIAECIKVKGVDTCELNKTKNISFHLAPGVLIINETETSFIIGVNNKKIEIISSAGKFRKEKYFYSPEYGLRIEAEKLVLISSENRIEWQIEIKSE
ncbi:MAG: alginate lyase family protein [Ignavibacteriae bacterium]|nr:alginate lyase family protein [Ignavibacteriota bacterium]